MNKITENDSLPRVTTVDLDEIAVSTMPTHRFPHKGPNAFLGELGGIWDHFREPVENTPIYQSLHERFKHDHQWEDTPLIRAKRQKFERYEGGSITQLNQQFEAIDELQENIKSNGYVASSVNLRKISQDKSIPTPEGGVRVRDYIVPDEPRVGVDHDGTYIRLGGGRHRLAIAKLLDIREIPGVILIQHPRYASATEH